ncbi:MAG: beta-ketoacyl synthase N-terminal-like domain-containing protein [Acidobacteriota bacterium]|nr:beta-ketoacyl synthase N-terminal-like domain-containing protein [Acidobacteriota bacterium]
MKNTIREVLQRVEAGTLTSREAVTIFLNEAHNREKGNLKTLRVDPDLKEELARYLRALLSSKGIRPPSDDSFFLDREVDSLDLLESVADLEEDLQVELYPTLLFRYNTLKGLSDYLWSEQSEAVVSFLEKRRRSERSIEDSPPAAPEPSSPDKGVALASAQKTTLTSSVARDAGHDIAVIGMACRFPGAADYRAFWDRLLQDEPMISAPPADRREALTAPGESEDGALGGYLEDVADFDHICFGFSEEEATHADPQLRLLLETAHQCIEDAGYGLDLKGSRTGVYIGAGSYDYWPRTLASDASCATPGLQALAGRLSHHFDLRGPSLTLDCGCASSLVAVHQAVRSLRQRECDTALVGGVNLVLDSRHLRAHEDKISSSNRIHPFESRADGFVLGEGVAALLLKPLESALEDGDHLHAVIKGSAVSHNGSSHRPGTPHPQAQEEVLRAAWRDAGVDPGSIDYFEAHGTATPLGDAVEIDSLKSALGYESQAETKQVLGTVKAHVGHGEAVAGLAGMCKLMLCFEHETIPAMPDFREPHPLLELDASPFTIHRITQPWPQPANHRRRGGVSAFSSGGTNAHLVLEAPPRDGGPEPEDADHLLPFLLSAPDQVTLIALARSLYDLLGGGQSDKLRARDISYSLRVGREVMATRLAVVAASKQELRTRLGVFLAGERGPGIWHSERAGEGHEAGIPLAETAEDLCLQVRRWVEGASLGERPRDGRRVPLPTTPFRKKRFWLCRDGTAADGESMSAPGGQKSDRAVERPAWEHLLSEIASDVLGTRLGADDSLFDHGVDSLKLEEIIVLFRQKSGIDLPVAAFFEHATLGELIGTMEESVSSHAAPTLEGESLEKEAALRLEVERLREKDVDALLERLLAN